MGNIIGMNNQENYNELSSTIPYLKKMEKDAKNLVLNISEPNVSNNGHDNIFTETENYELYKIFEKNLNVNNTGNELSDTSPFISSDAYNNLIINQTGGGEDDSSTSSSDNNNSDDAQTSDIDLVSNNSGDMSDKNMSEEDMSEEDMSEKDMSEKDMSEEDMSEKDMSENSDEMVLTDTVKKTKDMADSESNNESEMNEENMSTDSDMSTGNNIDSYFSSSAHSDNIDSSTNVTTISVGNRKVLSDSINTSDINMISIEE